MPITNINFDSLKTFLCPRPADSNKGDFGHSLLVGGNHGFAGSIMMSSIATARVGSGLTTVATQQLNALNIVMRYPELMASGVANATDLESLISKATVIGIGPGLGQDDWAEKLLSVSLRQPLPLVVDADALNLLAKSPQHNENWVLTPHPGEAARLLAVDIKDVIANREQSVTALQNQYGGVVILKGQHTLISADKNIYRCKAGNPGMASGGMGDLLTGIITGLIAQGIPLAAATQIGVYVHASAGDLAAKAGGERGLLATDLLPYVRKLVNPN